jgi:hypothetical protein
VASHVAECHACSEAISFLEAERDAGDREDAELPPEAAARDEAALEKLLEGSTRRGRRVPRRGSRSWIGLAAGLVMAVGLGVWLRQRVEAPPAGYREPGSEAVRALVADGESLPRGDFMLRWAAPEGSRCDVLLFAEDLRLLARRSNVSSEWRVPAEALDAIPKGGRLFWQVDALLPDGSRTLSRTYLVTVR